MMTDAHRNPEEPLEETAARLQGEVAELAARLRPFPSFMGMTTLQAIELDPPPESRNDWGCVVVLGDGEICELELGVIPGPVGPDDVDQVDSYSPLELTPSEYIHFATEAIRLMDRELESRSGGQPSGGSQSSSGSGLLDT